MEMRINSLKAAAATVIVAAVLTLCGFLAFAASGAHALADSSTATPTATSTQTQAPSSNDPWD